MVRARWTVLAAALALLVVGATWGTGVFSQLTGGGFADPESESAQALERIGDEVGDQDTDLVVLYTSESLPIDDPAVAEPIIQTLDRLRAHPLVSSVASYYDSGAPQLLSQDRQSTYAAVILTPRDEDALLDAYRELQPLVAAPGVVTETGGLVAFFEQSSEQTEHDIVRAELISFPILLILLVLIFRGVVAAVAPLVIGALAILGAFVATRLLTLGYEVSIFAINIITVIGLGMAIDYGLLVVNRFREELAAGRGPADAVGRTLRTAGRAVMISGLTTMLALASMFIFPHVFLRSLAAGGIAAIAVAMLAALTVLPALLVVLGPKINAGRVRLPWRRRPAAGLTDRADVPGANQGGWARLSRSVMRRPVIYLVGVLAVLALLASPALRLEFGGFDERVLPEGAEARVVAERIAQEFPPGNGEPIQVLLSGASPAQAEGFAAEVAALPEVTEVAPAAQEGGSTLLAAGYAGAPTGEQAWQAVRAIRELPAPAGAEVLVGGRTAADLDLVDELLAGLPWMLLLMAGAIMVVLFLAFGSLVLPLATVGLNLLSIGAAIGVVVWGFQDGRLAGLLNFTDVGFVQPAMLLLMLAVLFGISTDYQVFLLSRVREEWDATGDNQASVAYGLQRTGRIITAAALLLIVVVGGFATGEMAFVKLLGIGMIVAIAVDATLVRALLMPALMRLFGRANWWLPGPLDRVYRRYGINPE
ncbi:MMPL family transporter [Natronosporangium hydrolyticum]|uniref:MMPL family transporter n=1 Tax=Natronosporangium hydrolyticum TaxID=2811111 RepID=UPI001EFA076A|nr:MMPL family transporter [Natronosporangium hydrolyticum]